jgi:GntR family transcriptional regulator/MocR family aminotransferase
VIVVASTGTADRWDSTVAQETSQPVELLLSVSRDDSRTLGAQIEDQLRRAIRDGSLRDGSQVPSTRDLARQLGVSRRVIVDAYGQLAAEGYLSLRQGARPRVSANTATGQVAGLADAPRAVRPRFDFRPAAPDLSAFPRASWLRSLRAALASMTDADLGYGDPRGAEPLRRALAEYLGRVRGVVADPGRIVVTHGYSQGLGLICSALVAAGARRVAMEDPSNVDDQWIVGRAGLEVVLVGIDENGIRVDELERAAPDAVIVTPAHQQPSGVVLSSERRAALLAWLRERKALAIEDDYDAEYRYDRAAVGALQGLAPDHVVYAGSASKTLAPALRLGWLVLPQPLLETVMHEKLVADRGASRIEEYAFADFVTRGELDRHLRRMRARYRRQRDALVRALVEELPGAAITGIAAGLHVTVQIPGAYDDQKIRDEAARRGLRFATMHDYRADAGGPTTLMLGYGHVAEPAMTAGVREVAETLTAARTHSG